EAAEERFRALELIERYVAAASGGKRHEDLRHPIGMRRAAGDIDHRQAGAGAVVRAEKPALRALEELQADAVRRVGRGGRDAAIGRAIADRDYVIRDARE